MADNADKLLGDLADRLIEIDHILELENVPADMSTSLPEVNLDPNDNLQDDDLDTDAFVQQMRNANTVRKTAGDMKKFILWLQSVHEARDPSQIPPTELDQYMARFFLSVKKNNGEEYEPESLKSFQLSINRYMSEKKIPINDVEDREFKHSRDVLSSKKKLLRQHGKENKKNRADPFTEEEMNILYDKNYLGTANPRALINTMFINNTLHFGMRTRQENTQLRWGDIEMKVTSGGEEYLEHSERATKTRNGTTNDTRAFAAKMFSDTGNPRCPVASYKEYSQRRPPPAMEPNSPFYLGLSKKSGDGSVWFINQAIGKNTVGSLVKNMCEDAGISGRKVNHSARKTAITSLVHAGVALTLVMQLSGHKNVNSINNYSTASLQQQREMSSILTRYNRPQDTVDSIAAVSRASECEAMVEPGSVFRSSQELVEETLRNITSYENVDTRQQRVAMSDLNIDTRSLMKSQQFLSGATIHGNVIFQIGSSSDEKVHAKTVQCCKRRRIIYSDHSDSD